jgi:hypothetical protein
MVNSSSSRIESQREPRLAYYGALMFAVLIAIIGSVMMTATSSPSMKGAALLWLPAALQLIAGVWFGPWLGLLAGGVGAYAAGILAYGGWGLPDIIQNLIAGGVANAFLPGLLFRVFRIDPTFGSQPRNVASALIRLIGILGLTLVFAFAGNALHWGLVGYIPSVVLVCISPLFLIDLRIKRTSLIAGFLIVIVSCVFSASLGCVGSMVAGLNLKASIYSVGIGWFFGDTVSAILGLYVLAVLTKRADAFGLYKH